jgi:hypothetical protein
MEKDLLTGLLTKAYNKTSEEIAELLYDKAADSEEVTLKEGALNLVLDLDEQRVEKLKSTAKPDKDSLKSLRDQTIKEIMEDFEKKMKAKYSLESSSKGLDLVQEIIDQVSDCDISDDKVKLHPAYLQLEERKTAEYETLQQEHEDYKLNQDRRSRLSRVNRDVLGIFATLNPIESENTIVAQTRREDFLKKFEGYDYDIKEDGNHFVKLDGNRVEDKHGNPVKFLDFVQGIAAMNYDFKQSDDKGNAGNQGRNGGGGSVDIPKTEQEYLASMADLMQRGDKESVVKLNTAWRAAQKP